MNQLIKHIDAELAALNQRDDGIEKTAAVTALETLKGAIAGEDIVDPDPELDLKPRYRADDGDDEHAAEAIAFIEQSDFENAVRKIVAAHGDGKDFADIDGKRYVATDDGTIQVAVPRVIASGEDKGKCVYELLHHSMPDEFGKAERKLECCRAGKWRETVLAKAATTKVDPPKPKARRASNRFEAYSE